MVVLDYILIEGEDVQAYRLVRFAQGGVWQFLREGLLLASLVKNETGWSKTIRGKCGSNVICLMKGWAFMFA